LYTPQVDSVVCRFGIYVHSEWTYVGWEFVSIPNGHMSDWNLCPFRMDICQFGIYVHSEWTCMSDWNSKDNQVTTIIKSFIGITISTLLAYKQLSLL